MQPGDKTIDDARVWIDNYNAWFRSQIKAWINYKVTELTEPAFTKLDDLKTILRNQQFELVSLFATLSAISGNRHPISSFKHSHSRGSKM